MQDAGLDGCTGAKLSAADLNSEGESAAPVRGAEDCLEEVVHELLHGALGGEQPGGRVMPLLSGAQDKRYNDWQLKDSNSEN
jgi:hypothetical protein